MGDEPVFQFDRAEDSPGFLLWQVTNLWQRRMKAGLSELGLTHVQFVLLASLAWLSRAGGVVTQAALAEHARTDVMMTSTVLRALEEKGLVRRGKHPTDTRANALSLTEKAWPLVRQAVKRVEGIDREFFGVLGEGVEGLNENLRKLLENEGSEGLRSNPSDPLK